MVLFRQGAQVAEGEKARVMSVTPRRLDRVAADQLQVDHLRFFGPQFGANGSDSLTTWQPAGASYTSARQLADSVYRADPPSRGGV